MELCLEVLRFWGVQLGCILWVYGATMEIAFISWRKKGPMQVCEINPLITGTATYCNPK
jgi:hypothetical protein